MENIEKKTKKILGLDIGVSSVGVAVVELEKTNMTIKKMGVRIVPEDPNFHGHFYSGKSASKNAERTKKRGMRRNNQRFKMRRDYLSTLLKENGMFDPRLMTLPTYELFELRAHAVTQPIGLKELGRVLILLNQKRGFKSNRKANKEEKETAYKDKIKELETNRKAGENTIGQQLFKELDEVPTNADNKRLLHSVRLRDRVYLRKSYQEEFDKIWECQQEHFPKVLTEELKKKIRDGIIYWQRPLKSCKHLIAKCQFEKNYKVAPKSSPYFELSRIWQTVNNLTYGERSSKENQLTLEQKKNLVEHLFEGKKTNKKGMMSESNIKEVLNISPIHKINLPGNKNDLPGGKTYAMLQSALEEAGVSDPDRFLFFNIQEKDEKGGLFELWHVTYSLDTDEDIINTLKKRFSFTKEQAAIIAEKVGYTSDYGSLSTCAIRKLLPHLQKGLQYSQACDEVGYDHSGYKTEIKTQKQLDPIATHSLRNPVVEQILNQVVNVVNQTVDRYGPFDEIRVELARELKNNAKRRKTANESKRKREKKNREIKNTLKESGYSRVSGRDIQRYRLWEETDKQCLYCGKNITAEDLMHGNAEMEHILPRSRVFSNAMFNFILAHRKCNREKNQQTAYDFMKNQGDEKLEAYKARVNSFYKDYKEKKNKEKGIGITKAKYENLMCKGDKIPDDVVNRMLKDTQYIAREAVKRLKSICKNTHTTTGQITNVLRKEWELEDVLREIQLPIYQKIGQTEMKKFKDSQREEKEKEVITNWTKRDDHRHHAVDALICALTDQKIIFYFNNLNKIYQYTQDNSNWEDKDFKLEEFINWKGDKIPCPIPNLRAQVKEHLESMLVSFKKPKSKVLSLHKYQVKGKEQQQWTPRGLLHKETVMGKIRQVSKDPLVLKTNFDTANLDRIVHPVLKQLVTEHLQKYGDDPKKAFSKENLDKDPIQHKGKTITEVPVWEEVHTKRVNIENLTSEQICKIVDPKIKEKVKEMEKYLPGWKKSFVKNSEERPLYLNEQQEKQEISIKKVTVTDQSRTESITIKRDHLGVPLSKKGEEIPSGYVVTGNNHHALVYQNEKGKYKTKVVSFWEAVAIGLANVSATGKPYPIIDQKDHPAYGQFCFSMQINDLFVFDIKHSEHPTQENELDFTLSENRHRISKKLFRVQKISDGDFFFRHHLETTTKRDKDLEGITKERLSDQKLSRVTKIKINHLGEIIRVGE